VVANRPSPNTMGAVEYRLLMRSPSDSSGVRADGVSRRAGTWPVLALAVLVEACSSGPAPTTYDLSAPTARVHSDLGLQIVVPEPAAVLALSGQQIIVKDESGSISFLGGGQWAASLPSLVQARLVHTFENSSQIRAVARPSSGAVGDLSLASEIRSFEILTPANQAVVQVSVRLISGQAGRILAGRIFTARVPVDTVDGAHAVRGLNEALSSVLLEIVRWVASARPALPLPGA